VVIWTVGTQSHNAVRFPLKAKPAQLTTTPTLQVVDHPGNLSAWNLADCHVMPKVSKSQRRLQAAFQQAGYAGFGILQASNPIGRFASLPLPALGEMMTLGTNNATFTSLGIKLDGPLAYVARRAIWHPVPTLDHQPKGGLTGSPVYTRKSLSFNQKAMQRPKVIFRCRWHSVWRKRQCELW